MHELGHGLGFFGSAQVNTSDVPDSCPGTLGIGCYGIPVNATQRIPIIYDRFVEDALGDAMLGPGFANTSPELGNLLRSGDLFFDSPTTVARFGNQRPPLFAPSAFNRGSSYSHYDEGAIPTGDPDSLMTPSIARGEAFADPGGMTCALFQDIGWELAPACEALVSTTGESQPLASGAAALEIAGPNPFRDATALRVRLGTPEAFRATLIDALGREAEVLFDGPASVETMIRVPGRDLAPGMYVVRVETGGEVLVSSLVRIQ